MIPYYLHSTFTLFALAPLSDISDASPLKFSDLFEDLPLSLCIGGRDLAISFISVSSTQDGAFLNDPLVTEPGSRALDACLSVSQRFLDVVST